MRNLLLLAITLSLSDLDYRQNLIVSSLARVRLFCRIIVKIG